MKILKSFWKAFILEPPLPFISIHSIFHSFAFISSSFHLYAFYLSFFCLVETSDSGLRLYEHSNDQFT